MDTTLRRVVVAWRLLAFVWMAALVAETLLNDSRARPAGRGGHPGVGGRLDGAHGGRRPPPRVLRLVALSVSDAPQDMVGVSRAGARGYLTEDLTGPELVDGLRRIHAGDAVFSPRPAGFGLETFASFAPADLDHDLMSSVRRKLQLSNRHELTRWAADRGLT